mmetsp:Transcript_50857/g.110049  ORF Transcript_50857/g.110049 Transcript_50857/m.110049 type:complete len:234 (+) Transcript_50857:452-1153(+)
MQIHDASRASFGLGFHVVPLPLSGGALLILLGLSIFTPWLAPGTAAAAVVVVAAFVPIVRLPVSVLVFLPTFGALRIIFPSAVPILPTTLVVLLLRPPVFVLRLLFLLLLLWRLPLMLRPQQLVKLLPLLRLLLHLLVLQLLLLLLRHRRAESWLDQDGRRPGSSGSHQNRPSWCRNDLLLLLLLLQGKAGLHGLVGLSSHPEWRFVRSSHGTRHDWGMTLCARPLWRTIATT